MIAESEVRTPAKRNESRLEDNVIKIGVKVMVCVKLDVLCNSK